MINLKCVILDQGGTANKVSFVQYGKLMIVTQLQNWSEIDDDDGGDDDDDDDDGIFVNSYYD